MKKRIVRSIAAFICITMALALFGCGPQSPAQPPDPQTPQQTPPTLPPAPAPAPQSPGTPPVAPPSEPPPIIAGLITLATTTSTDDSGLLDFILPVFTLETGWEIRVISVGSGAAMQLGRDGEADVLLVHARAEEDKFVAEGFAERRYDVMYNDFVVVGPGGGAISHNNDIEQTFRDIMSQNLPFVSRGDNSGTHMRELQIWDSLGSDPADNSGYIEIGQGMGATLGMTVEMNAYTLADRATWLAYPNVGDLIIVCEGNDRLLNPYGVMVVSSTQYPVGAQAFVDWITSPSAQQLISTFGVAEYGAPLFFPDA